MRKQLLVKVTFIRKVNNLAYLLGFKSSYIAKVAKPGQFLHIKIDGVILRRPFSVHKIKGDTVYILFSVRGRGTELLSRYKPYDTLDIIGPLGNGFEYKSFDTKFNILVAGGIGVAPLVFLAEKMKTTKCDVKNLVLLGAKTKDKILCKKEFEKLNFKVYISSEDGSIGFEGTVVDLLKDLLEKNKIEEAKIYACGPKEMILKMKEILNNYAKIDCQVLVEQFMGCGLGVCGGCVINTAQGYKKICIDGPVFDLKKIYA